MNPEKPYQPSAEEMKKAEEMLNPYQKRDLEERAHEKEMDRYNHDRKTFEDNFTQEQLQTMAKLEDAAREIDNEIKEAFKKRFNFDGSLDHFYHSDISKSLSSSDRAEVDELLLKHNCLYRLGLITIKKIQENQGTWMQLEVA